MQKLEDYYPEKDYNIHIETNKFRINEHLSSKSSAQWGQGKINDKYYKLSEYSPGHLGEKQTIIVCLNSEVE